MEILISDLRLLCDLKWDSLSPKLEHKRHAPGEFSIKARERSVPKHFQGIVRDKIK